MHNVLVTAPAAEPVTTAEAKAHLRILHSSEDALIDRYVKSARAHVENTISRAIITQTWRLTLPAFPSGREIEIPRPPLVSISSVTYYDTDGASQTLASSEYHVLTGGITGRIERKASVTRWPSTERRGDAVAITYVAGYGASGSAVPEDLRNAVLMMAEHFYFNRGETAETNLVKNPVAADHLLRPYATSGWI
jgi:uncharacterized phiE125 gp8 family phage protein